MARAPGRGARGPGHTTRPSAARGPVTGSHRRGPAPARPGQGVPGRPGGAGGLNCARQPPRPRPRPEDDLSLSPSPRFPASHGQAWSEVARAAGAAAAAAAVPTLLRRAGQPERRRRRARAPGTRACRGNCGHRATRAGPCIRVGLAAPGPGSPNHGSPSQSACSDHFNLKFGAGGRVRRRPRPLTRTRRPDPAADLDSKLKPAA